MDQVFIVAEAGVNHNGDLGMALELVDVAISAGADAIKFQTFTAEDLVSKTAAKAEYQIRTTGADESQFEMLSRLELDAEAHRTIKQRCDEAGIVFMSTPFDIRSTDMLHALGMEIFKVPSGEITNLPYLHHLGGVSRRIILSTGMANLEEVRQAMAVLTEAGAAKDSITVLHATTEYPATMSEVNLRAMTTIQRELDVAVGYSDHTVGIEVSVAAVALGARVIEKHFTLDRSLPGPDHEASLEPDELSRMVASIRNVTKSLGDGVKRPTATELVNLKVARRSLVAAKPIRAGELFSEENMTAKRPGTGVSPMRWPEFLGSPAPRDFDTDEQLCL